MERFEPGATNALILEIFRVNGRVLATGDALVANISLTSARWQVLGAVALSPNPIPVAQIARNMGLTRQAVQRLVNEMMADGLLEFGDNPNHRRARVVTLTNAGERAYEAAIDRWSRWVAEFETLLTRDEIIQTGDRLRRIRRHLERSGGKSSDHA